MLNKITGIAIALIGVAMLYMGGRLLLLGGEPILCRDGRRPADYRYYAGDE